MARIADKYGLTNRYREFGSKRLVKRGRKRKYLLGAPSKRRKLSSYKKTTNKKVVQKANVQEQKPDLEYIKRYEEREKIVKSCPNCGSRYIEKSGAVFISRNCRATFHSIEELSDEKIKSIFEQKNEQKNEIHVKKKWWQFWK